MIHSPIEILEKRWTDAGKCHVAYTAKGSDGRRGVVICVNHFEQADKFRDDALRIITCAVERGEIVIESP